MMDNFSGHIPHKLLSSIIIVVAGLELNLYILSRQYIMTKIIFLKLWFFLEGVPNSVFETYQQGEVAKI